MSKIHLATGATHTADTAVLYDNLLANGVLTASSGDGLNALGPQTFDYWTPSAMPATLAVALGDDAEADCAAIIGHTLGSDGATVRVQYKGPDRTNLVPRSNTPQTGWALTRVVVVPDAIAAPDGGLAAKVRADNANGTHYVRTPTYPVTAGTIYTHSLYVQMAEIRYVRLAFDIAFSATQPRVSFDLQEGVAYNPGAGIIGFGIEPRGGGWWRIWCSAQAEATTSNVRLPFYLMDGPSGIIWTGDGVSGAYIWGAQVEVGTEPTPLIVTEASAVTVPARTNWIYPSQPLGSAGWALTNVTAPLAAIPAPDGSFTATALTEVAIEGRHFLQGFSSAGIIPGDTSVLSFYTKAGLRRFIRAEVNSGGLRAVFDLIDGIVSARSDWLPEQDAGIESVGDGWYRCWMRAPWGTNNANLSVAQTGATTENQTYPGDDTAPALYLWGGQLEAGTEPTSLIHTTSAPVATSWMATGVGITPPDNQDICMIFPAAMSDEWSLEVTGATAPDISVAMIGNRLIIPGGTLSGFVPLSSALEIDLQSQVTVGGQYRGSYIRKRGAGTSIPMAMQERDWVQTTGAAFIQHYNEGKPFVFIPCPDKLPDDAHYCWRGGDVLSGSLSVGSVHYDMSMQVSAYVG